MRRALLVVGKAPQAGVTKTRLVPPLLADQAAQLYRGFLLDSVNLGLDLGWERVSVIHPRGAYAVLRDLLPNSVHLFEQPGRGLQDALTSAFEAHLAAAFERVILISSDSPTVPAKVLEQACQALDTFDLALGPTLDGGYYLIGMRQPHVDVFQGIDWSTSRVCAQTLDRARQLCLKVATVDPWYDVDGLPDLDRLQHDLASWAADIAPHTRAALERIVRGPFDAAYDDGTSSVGVGPERCA